LPSTVDSYTLALDDAAPFVAATGTTTAGASTTTQLTVKVTYSVLQVGHILGSPAEGIDVAWASTAPVVAAPAATRCTTTASGTCSVGVATKVRLTVG
jgi:hypothetical protein